MNMTWDDGSKRFTGKDYGGLLRFSSLFSSVDFFLLSNGLAIYISVTRTCC